MNELKWYDVEFMTTDYEIQPVDVSGTLYYVYKDREEFIVFDTLRYVFNYIKGEGTLSAWQCFDNIDDATKYLEEL